MESLSRPHLCTVASGTRQASEFGMLLPLRIYFSFHFFFLSWGGIQFERSKLTRSSVPTSRLGLLPPCMNHESVAVCLSFVRTRSQWQVRVILHTSPAQRWMRISLRRPGCEDVSLLVPSIIHSRSTFQLSATGHRWYTAEERVDQYQVLEIN